MREAANKTNQKRLVKLVKLPSADRKQQLLHHQIVANTQNNKIHRAIVYLYLKTL